MEMVGFGEPWEDGGKYYIEALNIGMYDTS